MTTLSRETSAEEAERRKQTFQVELFKSKQWEELKDQIMEIERSAFGDKAEMEEELGSEFENPENVGLLLREGKDNSVVGYCLGVPNKDDQTGKTLHISSTALLSKYHGRGLVVKLLQAMDVQARQRGFEFYTRFTRADNNYAGNLQKAYKDFILEVGEPQTTEYGTQVRIRMRIPPEDFYNK